LFPRKLVSNFLSLNFCILFYVGPSPNPVPECITGFQFQFHVGNKLRFLRFLFQFHDTGEMGRNPGGKKHKERVGEGEGEQLPDKEKGKKKEKKNKGGKEDERTFSMVMKGKIGGIKRCRERGICGHVPTKFQRML
jgi:hypothetical protein